MHNQNTVGAANVRGVLRNGLYLMRAAAPEVSKIIVRRIQVSLRSYSSSWL
jgi:hypothetical protein